MHKCYISNCIFSTLLTTSSTDVYFRDACGGGRVMIINEWLKKPKGAIENYEVSLELVEASLQDNENMEDLKEAN